MEDIEKKLTDLESRLLEIENNHYEDTFNNSDLSIQLEILERIARFHKSEIFMERIEKLKGKLQKKSHFKYSPNEKYNRLGIINEKISRILETNKFMDQCVRSQGELIDTIDNGFEIAERNTDQARNELEKYKIYLIRKNKFIRIVMGLAFIFIALILIKIFN
jgi:t-SNARE complex subunit (syntaxin)